ncbi:DMT family transporter [Streptomyces sp. RS10V-4]|uniref:DMT family transporter n=1 Tax=Streptomyces rhizoryzae TaxID=2932493 RepID=UPI0020030192|nr:DMT family transporter [Streptomyces rhizoryzae]MCK7622643.1 DMT family transporter [Streptomyces rhizoryzae]
MGTWAAVLFALLAAASNALSVVLQRRAARTVPVSARLRLGLIADLLHRAVWLAGMLMVLPAACFQALALSLGALSVVQPIFVMELPLALLLGRLLLGGLPRRVSRRGWAGVALLVVGLGTALAAAAPGAGRDHAPLGRWVPALVVCAVVISVSVAAGLRRGAGSVRAACFGAGTAIAYALTAALLKDATHAWQRGGAGEFFASWQTYGFVLTGMVALFLMENAMQSGPLTASQPVLTLGDALVSLSLGVTLFDERVRAGWWLLPEALGCGLIVWGAVLLSQVSLARDLVAGEAGERPARPRRGRLRRRA